LIIEKLGYIIYEKISIFVLFNIYLLNEKNRFERNNIYKIFIIMCSIGVFKFIICGAFSLLENCYISFNQIT